MHCRVLFAAVQSTNGDYSAKSVAFCLRKNRQSVYAPKTDSLCIYRCPTHLCISAKRFSLRITPSFRMVRFVAFSSGTKPHGAVCRFFARHKTARCGLSFFRQARNRMVRFAVFSSGKKPHGAVSCFFARLKTARCGLPFFV